MSFRIIRVRNRERIFFLFFAFTLTVYGNLLLSFKVKLKNIIVAELEMYGIIIQTIF